MEKIELLINGMTFFDEDDFLEKMKSVILPYLKQYKIGGMFSSYDNTNLYYESYPLHNSKGNIVMVHGFCEFTPKFYEVIYQFLQGGYSVHILDHRGHGRSKRFVEDMSMVHIDSYDEYVQDLHTFVTTIVTPISNGKPLILYGHSMGGAISALYIEEYPTDFRLAILTSPMMQIDFGRFSEGIVHMVAKYFKLITKGGSYVIGHKSYDNTYDFESSSTMSKSRYDYIYKLREDNIQYQTFGANYHWVMASIKAIHKLQENADKVQIPVLLFQADNDSLVKADGQDRFIEKVMKGKKIYVPTSKHEIYNSPLPMRKQYFSDIFYFIQENLE